MIQSITSKLLSCFILKSILNISAAVNPLGRGRHPQMRTERLCRCCCFLMFSPFYTPAYFIRRGEAEIFLPKADLQFNVLFSHINIHSISNIRRKNTHFKFH